MSDNTLAETISPDQALDSFSANKMKDVVRLTAWAYEHVFIQGRSSSHQQGRVVIGWGMSIDAVIRRSNMVCKPFILYNNSRVLVAAVSPRFQRMGSHHFSYASAGAGRLSFTILPHHSVEWIAI